MLAKVLSFVDIKLKEKYFNTNLTLEHAGFTLYVVQGKETYGISHHLVAIAELTANAGV